MHCKVYFIELSLSVNKRHEPMNKYIYLLFAIFFEFFRFFGFRFVCVWLFLFEIANRSCCVFAHKYSEMFWIQSIKKLINLFLFIWSIASCFSHGNNLSLSISILCAYLFNKKWHFVKITCISWIFQSFFFFSIRLIYFFLIFFFRLYSESI